MTRRPHAAQRGLSLIELMIGIALALFITGAGGALLIQQLRESRALQLEAQLDQALGSAVDLIARQLRRAGYWGHAGTGTNPYLDTSAAPDPLSLRYSADATENDRVDANEQIGFRLRAGVLEIQLGAGNWQALTDPATVTVSGLAATPQARLLTLAPGCTQRQRAVDLALTATLVADPRVVRTVRQHVALRADSLLGDCPAASAP